MGKIGLHKKQAHHRLPDRGQFCRINGRAIAVVLSASSAMISVLRLPAKQNEDKSAASVAGGKRTFTEESIRYGKIASDSAAGRGTV
jgi:hypothetical protein